MIMSNPNQSSWEIEVTNLPPDMSESLLMGLFRGFGATKVKFNPAAKNSSGLRVITFSTASNCQRLIDERPETEWPDVSGAHSFLR